MRRFLLFAFCIAMAIIASAGPAPAHENRAVGPLKFVVGWATEPAFAGFMNSVQLRISQADGQPVVDVRAGQIKVEVSSGDQKVALPMEPHFRVGAFGEPGDYRAFMIPTAAGSYTFRFVGSVRGQKLNLRFISGEKTFDSPADPADVQFPEKHPSTGEIAQRIEREVPRLAAEDRKLTSGVSNLDDDLGTTRTLAFVGLGLGLIALVISLIGLRKRSG